MVGLMVTSYKFKAFYLFNAHKVIQKHGKQQLIITK